MKLRIAHKLFLMMLITCGLCIAFMLVVQRYTFERGLLDYAQGLELERLQSLVDVLEDHFQAEGNWTFIAGKTQWPVEYIRVGRGNNSLAREDVVLLRAIDGERTRRLLDPDEKTVVRTRPMWNRVSLLDAQHSWVAGSKPYPGSVRIEMSNDGVIIGYLQLAPPAKLSDKLAVAFNRQQLRAVFWAAMIALTAAALAAVFIAMSFGSPIRALARGTQALTSGRYDTRLDLTRNDELGRLAQDFNQLSEALQQAQQARQYWVADISHELSTPIAVLQAELETLEDGLRPLDADAVLSLSGEVRRLSLLVSDLRHLARFDSGGLALNRKPVGLNDLLNETLDRFSERVNESGLMVEKKFDNSGALVFGDADRLLQLFGNLFENTLRYTDPGGSVRISTQATKKHVVVYFEDSAPGVPDTALSKLFDRLYRVDPSRNRETGASGLGLAICESIVAAHSGTVRARHSALGGLCVEVTLPISHEAI